MTVPVTDNPLSAAAAVAQAMLDGSTSLIAGSREIARLALAHAPTPLDDDFAPFVLFDDRTCDLPVGESRRHWAADALGKKDAELATVEAEFHDRLLEACRHLVARFGSRQ
jgi:hypothetical protein